MTSIEQKIWDYLVEHKTPVQATTLAKRFIVSKGHVGRILKELADKNVLDVVNIGRTKFYKVKD
jgi:predicted transcriptional regulator